MDSNDLANLNLSLPNPVRGINKRVVFLASGWCDLMGYWVIVLTDWSSNRSALQSHRMCCVGYLSLSYHTTSKYQHKHMASVFIGSVIQRVFQKGWHIFVNCSTANESVHSGSKIRHFKFMHTSVNPCTANVKARPHINPCTHGVWTVIIIIFTVSDYMCIYIYMFSATFWTRAQFCVNIVLPSGGIHLHHYALNHIGGTIYWRS